MNKVQSAEDLASRIEASLLFPGATFTDVHRLCLEARRERYHAVCVNPVYVPSAVDWLKDSGIAVAAAISFPLGAGTTPTRVIEAMEAVKNGAAELDIVMPLGSFKSGRLDLVRVDLGNIVNLTPTVVHKIILETHLLADEEWPIAVDLAIEAGAQFVKNGTGNGPPVSLEVVQRLRQLVGTRCRIKAAGGIRTLEAAEALFEAGADRIGTSMAEDIMMRFRERPGQG